MGFFRSVGNFFSRAADVVGKVASFASKALEFVQKPLSELISKPVMGLLNPILDKLPFGIGNFVRPLAEKFLNNALSFIAPGGVGLLGALTKAIPSLGKLNDVVKTVSDVVGGINNVLNPQARANVAEIVAQRQAQLIG